MKAGSAEPGSAEPGSAESGSAESGSAEPGSAEPGSAEPGSAVPAAAGSSEPATPGSSEPAVHFLVAFGGTLHAVVLSAAATLADLRAEIEELLGVPAPRQRLVGWPPLGTREDALVGSVPRKSPQRVLLMGTRDDAWAAARAAAAAAAEAAEGASDGATGAPATPPHMHPADAALIAARVASFRPLARAGFRAGCWTAVLDVDYTLIDHRSHVERLADLGRPHLLWFVSTLYSQRYDMVIWSATSLRWAVMKMQAVRVDVEAGAGAGVGLGAGVFLGGGGAPAPPPPPAPWALAGYMHRDAMVPVHGGGGALAKPLGVLWGQFPSTSPATTIMLDDCRANFALNPQQGLRVRACRDLPHTRASDRELLHLAAYLALVRRLPSLDGAQHTQWRARLRAAGYEPDAVVSQAAADAFIAALPPLPPVPPPAPGGGAPAPP